LPAPFRYARAVMRIVVVGIVLLLATCAAAGTPKPNVRGVVVGSTVVCPPREPCDPPTKPIFVAFSRPGHPAVRARIGRTGQFAVYLRPARYSIHLWPTQTRRVNPATVRAPREGFVRLRLVVR
jgi:hypothetical protein